MKSGFVQWLTIWGMKKIPGYGNPWRELENQGTIAYSLTGC
jgi:hypothetical protein